MGRWEGSSVAKRKKFLDAKDGLKKYHRNRTRNSFPYSSEPQSLNIAEHKKSTKENSLSLINYST